jgi:thymidylate synthase
MMKNTRGFVEEWGDAGPIYGPQWRSWPKFENTGIEIKIEGKTYITYIKKTEGIDQITDLIHKMTKNPRGKKHIVSAWDVADIPEMALAPCHVLFQVNANNGLIDLQMFQRSCDQFLGVPFNIASYVMVNQIIANELGFEPRRFIHTFGDAHFYCGKNERGQWYGNNFGEFQNKIRKAKDLEEKTGNKHGYLEVLDWVNKNSPLEREDEKGYDHVTGILEQLANDPQPLPKLKIAHKNFKDLKFEDFSIEGYRTPYRFIKREMAS